MSLDRPQRIDPKLVQMLDDDPLLLELHALAELEADLLWLKSNVSAGRISHEEASEREKFLRVRSKDEWGA